VTVWQVSEKIIELLSSETMNATSTVILCHLLIIVDTVSFILQMLLHIQYCLPIVTVPNTMAVWPKTCTFLVLKHWNC
jgi:hypothetical protein